MLIVGLPIQALLQRLGRNGYLPNVGLCVLLGGLAFLLFVQVLEFTLAEGMVFGIGISWTVGSIAWLIRRPDQDVKVMPAAESHF